MGPDTLSRVSPWTAPVRRTARITCELALYYTSASSRERNDAHLCAPPGTRSLSEERKRPASCPGVPSGPARPRLSSGNSRAAVVCCAATRRRSVDGPRYNSVRTEFQEGPFARAGTPRAKKRFFLLTGFRVRFETKCWFDPECPFSGLQTGMEAAIQSNRLSKHRGSYSSITGPPREQKTCVL